MTEFEPGLASLIHAAKHADAPTLASKGRMRGALMATIAAGGATAAGTASAAIVAKGGSLVSASAGTGVQVVAAAKVALVGAALATAGTLAVVQPEMSGAPDPQGPRSLAVPVQQETTPEPEPEAVSSQEAIEGPTQAKTPVRRKNRSLAPKTLNLADELRLLEEVRSARRAGKFDAASAALLQYRRKFVHGALRVEASAETAMLLCVSGKERQGRSAAKRFLRRYPKSPFAVRVRSTCLE